MESISPQELPIQEQVEQGNFLIVQDEKDPLKNFTVHITDFGLFVDYSFLGVINNLQAPLTSKLMMRSPKGQDFLNNLYKDSLDEQIILQELFLAAKKSQNTEQEEELMQRILTLSHDRATTFMVLHYFNKETENYELVDPFFKFLKPDQDPSLKGKNLTLMGMN